MSRVYAYGIRWVALQDHIIEDVCLVHPGAVESFEPETDLASVGAFVEDVVIIVSLVLEGDDVFWC